MLPIMSAESPSVAVGPLGPAVDAGPLPVAVPVPVAGPGVAPPPVAGRPAAVATEPVVRRNAIFVVTGVALFMASIDMTIVATALPTINHGLHTRITWASWTLTAYLLGQAVTMPIAGRISDQLGRRRVFIGAVCLFTTASLLCGMSTSIYELVALRAVQAVGGGAFMPSATGIVSDHFGSNRDRAIGLFTSIFPIGGIVGPVLGGLILGAWSWRGIFLINVPIGLLLVVAALRIIPATPPTVRRRPDFVGAVQFGATILALMVSITNLGEAHVSVLSPSVVAPFVLAVLFGAAFLRRAGRSDNPIIPIRLLRARAFLIMNVINLIFGASALGAATLIPLYAQERFHISAVRSGTLLTARALGMIAVAGATTFLLRRLGCRLPIAAGFVVAAGGFVTISLRAHGADPYWWIAAGAALTGLGFGMAAPASNNAILSLATGDIAAITGLRGMFRQSGGIMCISIITAVAARSADQGLALGRAFIVFGCAIVAVIPLVFRVPDQRAPW